MRVGFIHIDVSWADDRFAGAGQIARVENNTVYLSVPEADLIVKVMTRDAVQSLAKRSVLK